MVVEGEAEPQQQPALDDAAGEPRVGGVPADGAQQDRVVLREARERLVGDDLPGLEVVRRAELVLGLDQLDVGEGGAHGPPRLERDLRADAVSCDDREAQLLHTSS